MKKDDFRRILIILVLIIISIFIFKSAGSDKPLNPIATIVMKNGSEIEIELYPDKAPNTVRNFVSLIKKGFYDGLIFHRVVPDFIIQGGDP